jgi:DNA polymerase-1
MATVTGRLSSSNPNMQNLPIKGDFAADIRNMFRASEGFTLVAFDYSQFELRIAAHLAQDEKMIKAFRGKEDIHRRTAAEVFNVDADAVTPSMRRQAKIINFGILYGMGASALAEQLEVPRSEAQIFLEEYFREFSGLARYRRNTLEEARRKGFVSTMVGRKRHLPAVNSSFPFVRAEAERMAINAPIQGSQADMIKKAMVDIDRALHLPENNDIYLLLQIHDELVFEIKKEKVDEFAPRIKELMESVEKLSVPLVVDVRKGPSLGAMSDE